MRKVIIATLLIIILVGGALLFERSWRLNRPISKSSTHSGQIPLSSLKIKNFSNQEVVSLDQFTGKVLLINFWASWCEACISEMPSIEQLHRRLKGSGFEILAINVDENPQKIVPEIVAKLGLSFPVYLDIDEQLSKAFDVAAIPFSAVVDRQGKVVWSESGERNWSSEAVVAEFQGLLK